ncbi:MAG: THUMP domain-containing protein [Myxococcota bacterium]
MSDKMRWYYASCSLGFEDLLAAEVNEAGGTRVREDRGGVSFQGTLEVGYRLCLWSRVGIRVFEELARRRIQNADDIYRLAGTVDWQAVMGSDQTFAVFGDSSSRMVRNASFAALRVKDAVADQLRETTGTRPDVDRDDPDVALKLVVKGRVATIARDLAGTSLHRRGWRPIQVKSPLNEALAAGLLLRTGWDRQSPLCDPMCGSGTFLVEAAHLASDRAPGLERTFGFERWPDVDTALLETLRAEALRRWTAGRDAVPPLLGNDLHAGALTIARESAKRAGVDRYIQFENRPLTAFQPDPTPSVVVVNPPYGVRIGAEGDLPMTWRQLGNWLKDVGQGEGWVLSGDPELTGNLRLKANQRYPVQNGGIDCRWLRYPLRKRQPLA